LRLDTSIAHCTEFKTNDSDLCGDSTEVVKDQDPSLSGPGTGFSSDISISTSNPATGYSDNNRADAENVFCVTQYFSQIQSNQTDQRSHNPHTHNTSEKKEKNRADKGEINNRDNDNINVENKEHLLWTEKEQLSPASAHSYLLPHHFNWLMQNETDQENHKQLSGDELKKLHCDPTADILNKVKGEEVSYYNDFKNNDCNCENCNDDNRNDTRLSFMKWSTLSTLHSDPILKQILKCCLQQLRKHTTEKGGNSESDDDVIVKELHLLKKRRLSSFNCNQVTKHCCQHCHHFFFSLSSDEESDNSRINSCESNYFLTRVSHQGLLLGTSHFSCLTSTFSVAFFSVVKKSLTVTDSDHLQCPVEEFLKLMSDELLTLTLDFCTAFSDQLFTLNFTKFM